MTKTSAKSITLRAPAELVVRLEAIAARYTVLTQHRIALRALELGLDAIDKDPRWFEKAAKSK